MFGFDRRAVNGAERGRGLISNAKGEKVQSRSLIRYAVSEGYSTQYVNHLYQYPEKQTQWIDNVRWGEEGLEDR